MCSYRNLRPGLKPCIRHSTKAWFVSYLDSSPRGQPLFSRSSAASLYLSTHSTQFKYMYSVCTVYVQCMYSICSVLWYVQCMYSVCTVYVQCCNDAQQSIERKEERSLRFSGIMTGASSGSSPELSSHLLYVQCNNDTLNSTRSVHCS